MELEWSDELAARFGVTIETFTANSTRLMDFPAETIRVDLMDGSYVEFRWAFAIVSQSRQAIAVFAEHCGHHVFPIHEAKVFRDGVLTYADCGSVAP
jgi:hypothetical protein